jgi:hypothetical protein
MKISTELFSYLTRSLSEGSGRRDEAEARDSARTGLIGRGVIIPCPARCGRQPVSVAIRDLSSVGIAVVHNQRLVQGEQFILRVPALDGQNISTAVLCTVVHWRLVGSGVYMIGARFAGLVQPTGAPAGHKPLAIPVESMATVFRQQAADGLSEDEAEQLRQVDERLGRLQAQ